MADCPLEMGGRLYMSRALQSTLASLAPVVHCGVVQACLGEVMGKEFGL